MNTVDGKSTEEISRLGIEKTKDAPSLKYNYGGGV